MASTIRRERETMPKRSSPGWFHSESRLSRPWASLRP